MAQNTIIGWSLALLATLPSWAQTAPSANAMQTAQTPSPAALAEIRLDAAQQAALGIRLGTVQPAQALGLLANATVTVPPGQEVTVAAAVDGVISQLRVGVGDAVRMGAPLADFSSMALAELRRQTRDAEAQARNAQAALQRDEAMFSEGLIAEARVRVTRNHAQAAQAHWQSLLASLRASGLGAEEGDFAQGQVRAPRAGEVVEVWPRVGQRVEAGAPLFRIADLRQLQLEIALSADKATQLKAGDAVVVPSHGARGVLLGVGRAVDASQQVRARARVTQVGQLVAGATVAVRLEPNLAREASGWQVPAEALLRHQGRTWVLRASAQGFTPVPVQVRTSDDAHAVVQGALREGDRMAVTGLAALRPLMGH